MPADPRGRAEVTNWAFAALNSVEMAVLPWWLLAVTPDGRTGPAWERFDGFFQSRMQRLAPVLAGREWLAGGFSIADILMADLLRLADRMGGLTGHPAAQAYVARATARPAFMKAHADQVAHFAAAD